MISKLARDQQLGLLATLLHAQGNQGGNGPMGKYWDPENTQLPASFSAMDFSTAHTAMQGW